MVAARCESVRMTTRYERLLAFADELHDAGKLCATIARAKMSEYIERGLIPRVKDDTATVTFIDLDGRDYAVTAHHVTEIFRKRAEAEGVAAEGYFLPAQPGMFVGPPFVRPPAIYPHSRPDIALRPIDRTALPTGKSFYKLTRSSPKFPVPYALVGQGDPAGQHRRAAETRGSSGNC
jgi:hypothetical protein